MNKYIVGFLLIVCLCPFVHADDPIEIKRVQDISDALQRGGISGLCSFIKEHQAQTPCMPSHWRIEHRPSQAGPHLVDLAAREFGQKLAVQLDVVAPEMRDLPPGDELSRQAHLLCDLSEWCASTPGHGNLFLAQRCLDLAAVGLARLAASLDFPLAECEKLAARMSPTWMSVEARARTLNAEAGTNLFAVAGSQTDMEKTWGAGGFLMRERRSGTSRPQGQEQGWEFIDTQAIKANLDFFEDDNRSNAEPLTLVHTWDSKRYERIVNGLELQNVNKALALLEFRSVVGRFPEKPEFTEEQLQHHEQATAEAAKYGIKVTRIDEGQPLGKAAFEQAWDQRPGGLSENHTLYATAWQAYDEVRTGQFLDMDTRAVRMQAAAQGPNVR